MMKKLLAAYGTMVGDLQKAANNLPVPQLGHRMVKPRQIAWPGRRGCCLCPMTEFLDEGLLHTIWLSEPANQRQSRELHGLAPYIVRVARAGLQAPCRGLGCRHRQRAACTRPAASDPPRSSQRLGCRSHDRNPGIRGGPTPRPHRRAGGRGSFVSETTARAAANIPFQVNVDLSMNIPPQPLEANLDLRIAQGLKAIQDEASFSAFLNYQRPGGSDEEREVGANGCARASLARAPSVWSSIRATSRLCSTRSCRSRQREIWCRQRP